MLPRNVRRIRSRTQRTASDSGVLRKGRTRRPGLHNARHCRAYCAHRRIAVVEDPPAEKAAPDMGAAATGYRASPNRAPDLPSTRNDGCNAADRPRRGKRRAAATAPPRQASSPERIVHSPVRSHVTARTCRHSAGAPSRHAVAIDHSPSAGGVTTNWPHDHRGTKPAESRTTSKRGEAPSGANEKQARKSARQDIFMTRNFTRIKIRHTERRMNSLEIRRDEVKDTKSRAQKQTFMFDYAETMYLRYNKDTENAADCKFFTGDMQDFAVEVIYYMTESGSTRLKRGDLQVGRTRMQGWPYKKKSR